jgi:methylmalonyl-CoA mutase N-terminal domain/subunit
MTKRLQVLLDDDELADIQRHARTRHQTTAAWVRDALRMARERAQDDNTARILRVIEESSRHAHPIGDIEQVLEEIERGYREPLPE